MNICVSLLIIKTFYSDAGGGKQINQPNQCKNKHHIVLTSQIFKMYAIFIILFVDNTFKNSLYYRIKTNSSLHTC